MFFSEWKKISGYSKRNIIRKLPEIDIVSSTVNCENKYLENKSIVFFSDLHWNIKIKNIKNQIIQAVNKLNPEFLICGGDLITYMSYADDALNAISNFYGKSAKFAVLGNWERRRRTWFSPEKWKDEYLKAGYRLLYNKTFHLNSEKISFHGLDDLKTGSPEWNFDFKENYYNILIAHNPDTAVDERFSGKLAKMDLVLCGHTHGGQIRIPFLGALKTSSKYWKKFEYGKYLNSNSATLLSVSSGIGNTGVPFRFRCRPEIMQIKFI